MMFWLKNLRMSGIQLANTRCCETISNCREKGGSNKEELVSVLEPKYFDTFMVLNHSIDEVKDVYNRQLC